VNLLEQSIAHRKASGKPVPETLYRQWFSAAHEAKLAGPGLAAARALVAAYPSRRNWREALVAYRQLKAPADSLEIDHFRLMRAAGVLAKGEEYQRMAQLLNRAGAPSEARSVLDEAVSRGLLDAALSPTRDILAEVARAIARDTDRPRQAATSAAGALSLADSHFAAGRYSEAASLYRAALGGLGIDSAKVNSRLGMALAFADRRPDAEAAFALAASDSSISAQLSGYGELARFWLAWLANPPTGDGARSTSVPVGQ
jgi:tetratricopeptide (TPR) repeat protein